MATIKRDSAIEWLRVASAAGIVWYHAGVAGSYWGYAGLIVFLIMSMMFDAGPNIHRRTSVSQLALRLLLPWVFWWLVYAAFNVVKHHPIIDTSHGVLQGFLASPSIHLWYLPFVFVALSLFGLVKSHLPTPALAVGAAVIAGALIWAIPVWRPVSLVAGYPLAQWAHALAPVFIGIVVGCGMRARWAWALAVAILPLLVWACFRPFPTVAPIYILGFALVALVLALPLPLRQRAPDFRMLFGSMLGVYLVHPLALAILRPVTNRVEFAGVVLAFVASIAGVLAAQWCAPWPSFLVLGTPMPADQRRSLFRSGVAD